MKFGIKIMPREVILDSQGRTVENHYKSVGYKINQCRIGKFVEIDVVAQDKDQAEKEVKKILTDGLYNPLIENYEILNYGE